MFHILRSLIMFAVIGIGVCAGPLAFAQGATVSIGAPNMQGTVTNAGVSTTANVVDDALGGTVFSVAAREIVDECGLFGSDLENVLIEWMRSTSYYDGHYNISTDGNCRITFVDGQRKYLVSDLGGSMKVHDDWFSDLFCNGRVHVLITYVEISTSIYDIQSGLYSSNNGSVSVEYDCDMGIPMLNDIATGLFSSYYEGIITVSLKNYLGIGEFDDYINPFFDYTQSSAVFSVASGSEVSNAQLSASVAGEIIADSPSLSGQTKAAVTVTMSVDTSGSGSVVTTVEHDAPVFDAVSTYGCGVLLDLRVPADTDQLDIYVGSLKVGSVYTLAGNSAYSLYHYFTWCSPSGTDFPVSVVAHNASIDGLYSQAATDMVLVTQGTTPIFGPN